MLIFYGWRGKVLPGKMLTGEAGYFIDSQVLFSRDEVKALYDSKHVKRVVRNP